MPYARKQNQGPESQAPGNPQTRTVGRNSTGDIGREISSESPGQTSPRGEGKNPAGKGQESEKSKEGSPRREYIGSGNGSPEANDTRQRDTRPLFVTGFTNGCFDLLHDGHKRFLTEVHRQCQELIVAINSDASAERLKAGKWGVNYPLNSISTRVANVSKYAERVFVFDTEDDLRKLIEKCKPDFIAKGPDYQDQPVTGSDIARVLIVDTPETKEVHEYKRKAYGLKD